MLVVANSTPRLSICCFGRCPSSLLIRSTSSCLPWFGLAEVFCYFWRIFFLEDERKRSKMRRWCSGVNLITSFFYYCSWHHPDKLLLFFVIGNFWEKFIQDLFVVLHKARKGECVALQFVVHFRTHNGIKESWKTKSKTKRRMSMVGKATRHIKVSPKVV